MSAPSQHTAEDIERGRYCGTFKLLFTHSKLEHQWHNCQEELTQTQTGEINKGNWHTETDRRTDRQKGRQTDRQAGRQEGRPVQRGPGWEWQTHIWSLVLQRTCVEWQTQRRWSCHCHWVHQQTHHHLCCRGRWRLRGEEGEERKRGREGGRRGKGESGKMRRVRKWTCDQQ